MTDIKQAIDFAFRVMVLLFAITFGILFMVVGARAALAASLKQVAIVKSDVLTVGDLFDGLSKDKADYVLGPAPQPGHDMTLNAVTLMRIATVVDLPWQPRHSAEQITVRRAATVLGTKDITAMLRDKISKGGFSGKFDLTYTSQAPEIVLPLNTSATADITDFRLDKLDNRFDATLVAPSKANPMKTLKVSGKIDRLVTIPVLKTAMRNGDIINQSNIEYINIKSRDLQHDYMLSADDLVGMTPRRMAEAGEPLRTSEMTYPRIVSRGQQVTLLYRNNGMELTAAGRALQNGAKGDLVSVVNTTSSRTVEGIVSGERIVTVQ